MKRFLCNCLKLVLLTTAALSSGLAIVSHYSGSKLDPVMEVQKLTNQHRRDDALDMIEFFKENQTGDKETLNKMEDNLEYTTTDKIKSFTKGAVKGEVYDTYSGIGAISADLCVVGDLRDLGIQSWRYLINNPDFDALVMFLSSVGVILSAKPFIHGIESFGKNTVKYLKNVSKFLPDGILQKFMSGKIPLKHSEKIWDLLKKNEFSIPRTASCLSNIHSLKQIDVASDLIKNHKRVGNAFINLTGDKGLSLYSSAPGKFKDWLIDGFKRNPRAVLGITKSHLFIHSIKIFDKYGLTALFLPVTTLSLLLSFLPLYLVWILFIGSTGYLAFLIHRKFTKQTKGGLNKC